MTYRMASLVLLAALTACGGGGGGGSDSDNNSDSANIPPQDNGNNTDIEPAPAAPVKQALSWTAPDLQENLEPLAAERILGYAVIFIGEKQLQDLIDLNLVPLQSPEEFINAPDIASYVHSFDIGTLGTNLPDNIIHVSGHDATNYLFSNIALPAEEGLTLGEHYSLLEADTYYFAVSAYIQSDDGEAIKLYSRPSATVKSEKFTAKL